MRLPSALASIAWAYVIYRFAKEYFGEKTALIATLIFSTSLQINIISKAAIADAVLNLFITLSMFSIYRYIDKREKRYLYFAFFWIALGTLDKGPVAIMIPLVVTFIYLLTVRNIRAFFEMVFDLRGILIFALIALPWYIAEYLKEGDKFIEGFLLKHNLERFNSSFEHHSGNYFYYFFVLIFGFLPFSGYLIEVFKRIKDIYFDKKSRFLIIWFVFVFIFFSLSKTKLPHYVIYGYTPLFIFMADRFKRFGSKNLIFVTLFLVILLFLPQIALFVKDKVRDIYAISLIENAKEYFNLYYQGAISISIVALISINKFVRSDLMKLFMLGAIFSTVINYVVVRAYANLSQEPIKEAALFAKRSDLKVFMGSNLPTFLYYYQNLSQKEGSKDIDAILIRSNKLKHYSNYKILFEKNGIYLIELQKN
jgi:4-amino-4-deoxy-L-arabinose transferase-like glycosyltransferase